MRDNNGQRQGSDDKEEVKGDLVMQPRDDTRHYAVKAREYVQVRPFADLIAEINNTLKERPTPLPSSLDRLRQFIKRWAKEDPRHRTKQCQDQMENLFETLEFFINDDNQEVDV